MNDAPKPKICDKCEFALIEKVKTNIVEPLTLMYCPHNLTLTCCDLDKTRIINWSLEGPLSCDQANSIIKSMVLETAKTFQASKNKNKLQ